MARELCGVNKGTHNPPFGQFYHDPVRGDHTGLMCAAGVHISLQKIRENETVKDLIEGLRCLFGEYLSYDITSIQNSLTSSKAIRVYQILREKGRLPIRVGSIISGREQGLVESFIGAGIRSGFGDE